MSSPALQKAAPAVLSQGSVERTQQFVNQQVWDNHKIHCHPTFISARLHRTAEYPGRPCRSGAKENCCKRRAICSPVVFTLRLLSDQAALMSCNNQELMWVNLRSSFLINHIVFHFYQAFFKYKFLNRPASDCDVNRFYNYSVHTPFTTISVSCAKLLHHFSFWRFAFASSNFFMTCRKSIYGQRMVDTIFWDLVFVVIFNWGNSSSQLIRGTYIIIISKILCCKRLNLYLYHLIKPND